jgi:hypothetical protein
MLILCILQDLLYGLEDLSAICSKLVSVEYLAYLLSFRWI